QRQGVLFSVVVAEHPVAAVERALGYGVEQCESRNHRACGQDFDLQFATRHVVDFLGEIEREFMKDVYSRPCALEAEVGRTLRTDDSGEAHGDRSGGTSCCAPQKLAARGFG